MKGKKHLLTGLVFGMVIGWALGFLRLPYVEKNDSFLLGFIAALTFVSLVFVLLAAWNRTFLPGMMGKKPMPNDLKSTRIQALIWVILVGILILGGIIGGLTVYRQKQSFTLQIQKQDKKVQEMAALLASMKKNDPAPLVHSVLYDVGEELKHNPGRTLSDSIIVRIAALSFSLKPYNYIEGDSLSEKPYSPERGQLLQALVLMNIDTGSFARIKRHTLFAGADLKGADLKGLDLSGIQLKGANLKDADLSGADLKGADLGEANLWGANLNHANLSNADLKRADLSWAQLNEATLRLANLNGANLTNAQFRRANLFDATIQWAQLNGALFNEANLSSINLVGANLTKVNLTQANIVYSDLRRINLSEAVLVEVKLDQTMIDKNWPDKLKKWQPTGMKEMQESYFVANDTFDSFKLPLYRLRKN